MPEKDFENLNHKYPNLPTKDFIHTQTKLMGGEVYIVGLTPQQAAELVRFAEDKNIKGSGYNEMREANPPLSDDDIQTIRNQGYVMPDNAVNLYLGHTTECYKPLWQAFGIKTK